MKASYADCYINTQNADFSVQLLHCGIESSVDHFVRPTMYDRYVLQYVTRGKGKYTLNGRMFNVSQGDLFYIPEGYLCSYSADANDPYNYYYIAFTGIGASLLMTYAGFSPEKPIIRPSVDLTPPFVRLYDSFKEDNTYSAMLSLSCFYSLLAQIFKTIPVNCETATSVADDYVTLVKDYIKTNYPYDLTVTELSEHIGLNRSYLSTIFKKQTGISPMDYLIDYRIAKSIIMLKNTNMSITEISILTGFKSPQNFYIRFNQKMGKSPQMYRKNLQEQLKELKTAAQKQNPLFADEDVLNMTADKEQQQFPQIDKFGQYITQKDKSATK